jgi:hypothetical protein
METTDVKPAKPTEKRTAPRPPFNPYDLVIVGYDDHPGIAADTKPDPEKGITAKDAEKRRKLYVQLFDERAHLPLPKERIALTRAWGVTVPVQYIVFDGVAYVVDGRQRVKAARAVYDEQKRLAIEPEHLVTVPGVKYEGDIDQLFAASRAMNVHTDEPPMMKARSMTRLLMEDVVDGPDLARPHKRTIQQVAEIYGCSDQHVRDMCKLFESSDTVKKALEDLKQPTIGLLLTSLAEDQQIKVLEELKAEQKAGGKVTVDRARKKVQEAKGKTTNSPTDKVDSAQRILRKLSDGLDDGAIAAIPPDVLSALDSLARTLWGGSKTVKFPTPINKQDPGYTLDILSKLGD